MLRVGSPRYPGESHKSFETIGEVRRTGTRFILSFTKEERLCRLMCGKAQPFRDDAFLESSGEAQPRRSPKESECDGKPKAFRTSDGEAVGVGGRFSSPT